MLSFHRTHPEVAMQFENGNFVVKKSLKSFSAISLDHAHEQNNKIVTVDGGAVGRTGNSAQQLR